MSQFSFKNLTPAQIIGIIGIILLITFIAQNLENVDVKFITLNFSIPLFLLIIIVFFIGFYSSIIAGSGLEKFFRKTEKITKNHISEEEY